MSTDDSNIRVSRRQLRSLPSFAAALILIMGACASEDKHFVPNVGDGMTTPTMATTDVETIVSDSGYTRYKIVTPLWQMFEDAEDPFWRFPEGIALEQYDQNMQAESNVECDSATYFSRQRLWRLDGNVVMVNTLRDSFLTQQLFWDQLSRKIYSDSFIHIVRSDRIIEGYGFESNQNMTAYSVNQPTAILPVERFSRADTTKSDTVVANSQAPVIRASERTPNTEPNNEPAIATAATPAAVNPTQNNREPLRAQPLPMPAQRR